MLHALDNRDNKRGYWPLIRHHTQVLFATPITAIGLRMSNETIRLAVCTRLGTRQCEPHTCPCGALVDARRLHTRLIVLSTKCRSPHQTHSAERHYMAQPVSS